MTNTYSRISDASQKRSSRTLLRSVANRWTHRGPIMAKDTYHGPLEQVDPCCWRIPKSYRPGMRVDGLIFANDKLIKSVIKDQAPDQVANVAFLPGIQGASIPMPDIHWGYGFCIGGVAATDPRAGG